MPQVIGEMLLQAVVGAVVSDVMNPNSGAGGSSHASAADAIGGDDATGSSNESSKGNAIDTSSSQPSAQDVHKASQQHKQSAIGGHH